jgi:hypothetical protein
MNTRQLVPGAGLEPARYFYPNSGDSLLNLPALLLRYGLISKLPPEFSGINRAPSLLPPKPPQQTQTRSEQPHGGGDGNEQHHTCCYWVNACKYSVV